MLLDIILSLVNLVIFLLMIWLCAQFLLAVPKGIFFAFKKVKGLIGGLFSSISLIKFPNNAFKNIFTALLAIFFGWLSIETGGDFYSFGEIFSSLIFSTIAVLIVINAEWKGMD